MRLVPFAYLLKQAKKERYAVPALNVTNMETIQAITMAAEKEQSPLIVQLYRNDLEFAGEDFMVAMTTTASRNKTVPICLSLDHGRSFAQAKACIDAGFTGVMIDLSEDSFEANIHSTIEVVQYAHTRGVSVEAELGTIVDASCSAKERACGMTDPDMAREFVQRTGVDALAVSIGTAHGIYSSVPEIDFQRAKEIIEKVPVPIVVHGGSNTPDDAISELVKMGVAKVNIGTDLVIAFNKGVLEAYDEFGPTAQLNVIMSRGREQMMQMAQHKIQVLNRYRKS